MMLGRNRKTDCTFDNPAPPRLLRIEIINQCNYDCTFCCWQGDPADFPLYRRPILFFQIFVKALVRSGCRRAHLTGGEPLLVPRAKLCEIVFALTSPRVLGHFFITTNASLLDDHLCYELYRAGLRDIVISIGGHTNSAYRAYARPASMDVDLDFVLGRVEQAVRCGLSVRVDVPLSTDGIHDFEALKQLIARVQEIGVRDVTYFRLHKTKENKDDYKRLTDSEVLERVTAGFMKDSAWKVVADGGRTFFCDGHVRNFFYNGHVKIPFPCRIEPKTINCKKRMKACGDYCQGTYAVYLLGRGGGAVVRACHHEFPRRDNEFPIDESLFERGDVAGVSKVLRRAWQWSAGEESLKNSSPTM